MYDFLMAGLTASLDFTRVNQALDHISMALLDLYIFKAGGGLVEVVLLLGIFQGPSKARKLLLWP